MGLEIRGLLLKSAQMLVFLVLGIFKCLGGFDLLLLFLSIVGFA